MRNILWLQEITADSRREVGEKAFNLAQIARAGIAVPAAFCIASSAFEESLIANDLVGYATGLLAARDGELAAGASRLQKAVRCIRLTPALHADILSAYRALASGQHESMIPVAVRSSASGEDQPGA